MAFGLSALLCELFLPSALLPFFILSRRLRKFFSVCRGRVYSGDWQGLKFLPKPAPTSFMVNSLDKDSMLQRGHLTAHLF